MSDGKRKGQPSGLAAAALILLILYGVVLVWLGGPSGSEPTEDNKSRLWEAYKSAEHAETALSTQNYGEALDQIRYTKQLLRELVEPSEAD
jgi:hypothetical protein